MTMKKPTTSVTYCVGDCELHYFSSARILLFSDIDGDELRIEGVGVTQLSELFRNALCCNSPAINARIVKDWPNFRVRQLQEISAKLTELWLEHENGDK